MEPNQNRPNFSREKKHRILGQLIDAELFESFTHGRYQGQKRFSLEGAESLIPALHQFIETAAATGAEEVVMGMAHRGRLNVLANILQKPYAMIFNEFEDNIRPDPYGGDGDVKYHRGFSSDYTTTNGAEIHISLTANPSHLEAVDPVVEGRARAKQRQRRANGNHRISQSLRTASVQPCATIRNRPLWDGETALHAGVEPAFEGFTRHLVFRTAPVAQPAPTNSNDTCSDAPSATVTFWVVVPYSSCHTSTV